MNNTQPLSKREKIFYLLFHLLAPLVAILILLQILSCSPDKGGIIEANNYNFTPNCNFTNSEIIVGSDYPLTLELGNEGVNIEYTIILNSSLQYYHKDTLIESLKITTTQKNEVIDLKIRSLKADKQPIEIEISNKMRSEFIRKPVTCIYTEVVIKVPNKLVTLVSQDTPFDFGVSAPNYKGEFKVTYELLKGVGVLKVGSTNIGNNSTFSVINDITKGLIYTPTKEGLHELLFTVEDNNGQKVKRILTIDVKVNDFVFRYKVVNDTLIANIPVSIKLTATMSNTTATSFNFTYTNTDSGIFKVNNSEIKANGTFSLKKDVETIVTYTPSNTGFHTLKFTCTNGTATYNNTLPLNVPLNINIECTPGGSYKKSGLSLAGENVMLTFSPKQGYHFTGLYDNDKLVSKELTYKFIPTKDVKYKAIFSENSYTVTVNKNIDGGSIKGSGAYDFGSEVSLTQTTKEHYNWLGWSDSTGKIVSLSSPYKFKIESNTSITANWELIKYQFKFIIEGKGDAMISHSVASYGQKVTYTAKESDVEYRFSHWLEATKKVSENPVYMVDVNRNITLTVVFVRKVINVSTSVDGNGTLKGGGEYKYGESFSLVATPNKGNAFVHYLINGSTVTNNPYTQIANKDHTVIAKFKKLLYNFSYTATSGGTVTSTLVNNKEYEYNTSLSIEATPLISHNFTKWQRNGLDFSTSRQISSSINDDNKNNFKAIFDIKKFTIKVQNGTGGGVFEYGSSTTLIPTIPKNYKFIEWQDMSNKVVYSYEKFPINNITSHSEYQAIVKYNAINISSSHISLQHLFDFRCSGAKHTSPILITYSYEFFNPMDEIWEEATSGVVINENMSSISITPEYEVVRNLKITNATGGGYNLIIN